MSRRALLPLSDCGRPFACAFWIFCLLLSLSRPAAAQNLIYTFGGSYDPNLSYSDGQAFDGTNYTDLPPTMDLGALEGGTFTASFTVPAVLTPSSQTSTSATYGFGPAASIQFTLFDAAGQVKYQSSGSAAFVEGDVYRFPYGGGNANQIVYASIAGFDVLGVIPPAGASDLGSIAQFNFANYTDPAHTHLSDFSFPTDPATYLSFPERQFNVQVSYGDGDIENGVDPYRFFDTNAYYTVNSVRVTATPEPGAYAILPGCVVFGAGLLFRRRRTSTRRDTACRVKGRHYRGSHDATPGSPEQKPG